MCGIFGCALLGDNSGEVLYSSLKRLEYRGYDSAGQATIDSGRILVAKDVGRIDEVDSSQGLSRMRGRVGIGHTRWATHGAPSRENAHPHLDCSGRIAIVHNGIIENFMELRELLQRGGHVFKSRTDSEVISHLVEDFMKSGEGFVEAVRLAAESLRGSFAVAAICLDEPDKVVCIRKESPLIVGIGEVGNFCSSDIPALLPYTNKVIPLEDGDLAILDPKGFRILDWRTGSMVEREVMEISWSPEVAMKSGFAHFMLKEIYEQPMAIRNVLRGQRIYYELAASMLRRASKVFLVACGTSHHACIFGSYAMANLSGLASYPIIASEFEAQCKNLIDGNTLVLAVSQSGETADTLNAVRAAKAMGASVIGITNTMGSSLTRLSDVYIGQNSGPEVGVAATKTFTAQVVVLLKLAMELARSGSSRNGGIDSLAEELAALPSKMEEAIRTSEEKVKGIALKYSAKGSFCFLARGVNVPTALEGRLKLLELSYLPALAYPAGESKHGFIAVVEEGYPVIFLAPRDGTRERIIGNMMEMKARGASIIALIERGDEELKGLADDFIEMPPCANELLYPPIYAVPLQLFAYYTSTLKGYDPDMPRNLAKSVTVM
ncbi:MAG: glutamine--fructose-6-phosphate transaminase (isomerizing) [Candidatus Bathyarchaeia archaeon]